MKLPSRLTSWLSMKARLILACTAVASCSGSGGPGGVWDVPEVDRKIILAWLLCSDCTEGELDHVVATGTRLVPYLSAALLDGPTRREDSLATVRAHAAEQRVAGYRARRPGQMAPLTPVESVAFVQGQRDAFELTYRLRAAQALVRIDSLRAAVDVAAFCHPDPALLARNPQYRASFKVIGACP